MDWTLLVPGALLPAPLAPELTRALQAPRLVRWLLDARAAPEPAGAGDLALAPGATTTPHWAWLAAAFGLDSDAPVTAPYAWHGAAAPEPASAPDGATWIARCDPVHMAIARDHFVVTDLGAAPLRADEARQLMAEANAALAARAAQDGTGPLRLAARAGHWYLLAAAPLQLRTFALDGVLGRSAQDRLPTGTDARRWRILANDVQMCWHASAVTAAREDAGQRSANALWLHGGGRWQPLAAARAVQLRMPADSAEAATARGWLDAARAGAPAPAPAPRALPDNATVALERTLFDAHAHQAWETWLARLPQLEERIDAERAAARAAGARDLRLVLCGTHQARSIALPLAAGWRPWPHRVPRQPGPLLQRWLAEAAP